MQDAVFSAVITGSFTWSALSKLSIVAWTIVQITWCCSLTLAMVAVAVELQQSVFLIRVESLSNAHLILRRLLSAENIIGPRIPRQGQLIIWHSAVALLEWSIYVWLVGFLVFV